MCSPSYGKLPYIFNHAKSLYVADCLDEDNIVCFLQDNTIKLEINEITPLPSDRMNFFLFIDVFIFFFLYQIIVRLPYRVILLALFPHNIQKGYKCKIYRTSNIPL